jgi:type II secretory pathway pseudopilin PulG
MKKMGFTLMELLIVVALVATIMGSTLAGMNIKGQFDKSNDAKRKAHIGQLAQALEHFYSDHGCYPSQDEWKAINCNAKQQIFSNYIASYPCDPTEKKPYTYIATDTAGNICTGTCGQCYGYRLLTTLANTNDPDIVDTGYTDETDKKLNYGKGTGSSTIVNKPNMDLLFAENGRDLMLGLSGSPKPTPPAVDTPVTRNVMVIDFNPVIESASNMTIRAIKAWHDPKILESQFITSIASVSAGYLTYKIVERKDNIDTFPVKEDGSVYTDQSYLDLINGNSPPQQDTPADYLKILTDYNVCDKINTGQIQEVWIWGAPWFGLYPTTLGGTGSFYIGYPPITDDTCVKPLIIMGFRYDQDVTAMLSFFAKRSENALSYYFNEQNTQYSEPTGDWGKFSRINLWSSGNAACGLSSHAPNATNDNDFGSVKTTAMNCDAWNAYPTVANAPITTNCAAWGCTQFGYSLWWLSHLPKTSGQSNSMWNNWWRYITLNE